MIKNKRIYLVTFLVLFMAFVGGYAYLYFLQGTKEQFIHSSYEKQAVLLRESLDNMIVLKQKATLGLAMTIAQEDKTLPRYLQQKNIPDDYYDELIENYNKNTLYKNVWIQVLDAQGISLYRSWSRYHGTDLSKIRADIRNAISLQRPMTSISIGEFDISLKSIAPVFEKKKFVGLIEVITHFNSIAHILKSMQVASVVLADARFKKQLKHPWNKVFIGDYYVSNLDINPEIKEYLFKHDVKNYFNDSYKVENGYLIISSLIKEAGEPIGVYIMFKKLTDITFSDVDDFIFKWVLFGIAIVILFVILVNMGVYYILQKQRRYYKNIIDTSDNIVLINDGKMILDVNKAFFNYFQKYKTLQEFLREHHCVCEFFVQEEGYIQKEMDGMNWVEYLLAHSKEGNKIKMQIDGAIYYFLASASKISEDSLQIATILADITEQEIYKQELEERIITDVLTGIKNRRFYESRMQYEVARSCRYNESFSIIMFDIDHFKQVNDQYGHDVGDKVLVEYTEMIANMLRESDLLCRIGGEEFVIITPHTSKLDAYKLAEKIRKTVAKSKHILPITMSFGVTEYRDCEDKDSMFKRADQALYEAKESGRNRVVLG
jgi:diguanylate cyclase (GGDEF)-like protein